ncbi:hypothetical protein ABTZ99_11960 [Actinosynnema sp. NPDC002837]
MPLRLAYLNATNAFTLLRLLPMNDRDEDVEILALRHQITILERQRHPAARFVFTGTDGGFHRRSNFRRRVRLPALRGDTATDRPRINPVHFHDLRHTHKTWLIEDRAPKSCNTKGSASPWST